MTPQDVLWWALAAFASAIALVAVGSAVGFCAFVAWLSRELWAGRVW